MQNVLLGMLALAVGILVLIAFNSTSKAPTVSTATAPQETPTSTAPAVEEVLWMGDSYTSGTGAPTLSEAESTLAGADMGWNLTVDAQGSTGYIADGAALDKAYGPFSERLLALDDLDPDLVILEGGRNDALYPAADAISATNKVIDSVARRWPDAQIVAIAPYYLGSNDRPLGLPYLKVLRDAVARHDGMLIDPIGDGWVGPGSRRYLSEDGTHPSVQGHRYIADRLVRQFKELDL